jgi:hypothetical protein
MARNPAVGVADRSRCTSVARAGHRRVAAGALGLDAAPAPVLPPQDGLQHVTAIRQAVGLTDQPHPLASRTQVSHRRAKVEVLPARQSDLADPLTGRSQIPVVST